MRWTAWDRRTALSSGALAALAFVVAFLLAAVTDEGGVAWGDRLVRALPAAPLCGAVATALSLRTAERRGELLALGCAGIAPRRAALPSALGGALVAVLLPTVALASTGSSVASFFPRVSVDGPRWDGARFVDVSRSVEILPSGAIHHADGLLPSASLSGAGLPAGATLAVALALALTGFALPLHMALGFPHRRRRAVLVAIAGVGATIVLFQLAAQAIVPAFAVVSAPVALLAIAPFCYREAQP